VPSELQRVAQGLVDCLDEAPRVIAALQRRADICRQDAAVVTQLSSGRATVAAQQLDAAARACEAAAHHLSLAPPKARDWALRMVEGIRTGPVVDENACRPDVPGGSTPPAERRPDGDRAEPEADKPDKTAAAGDEAGLGDESTAPRLTHEDAWRLFQKLPDRSKSGVSRPKTRGKWIDHAGVEQDLVSAEDEQSAVIRQFLRERNIGPETGEIMSPSHVETKFGMFMRRNGLKHESIVINNIPCEGEWSCGELLRDILPPGATLTVFGPAGFKRTYPLPPSE
jgi:hypothetical protein